MFDFIRNLTKSAEEKRLETLNAYVDGELSAGERRELEARLEEDAALRKELAQLRQVKQGISQLPRMRAPRNFTLDPAVYGRPQRQPAYDLYPVLRVATALAAFFFIVAVVLDLTTPAGGLGQPFAAGVRQEAPAADSVAEEAAEAERPVVTRVVEEVVVEGESVEVTRLVTESVEEEEMAAAADEEALEEAPVEGAQEEVPEAETEAMETEAMEAETATESAEGEMVEAPAEEPAAEGDALMVPTEDELTGEAEATGEGERAPAAAAPAVETVPAETLPPPTLTSEAPEAAAQVAPTAEAAPVEEPVDDGLPILLIAEIAFGIGLLILLSATLLIRRNL